MTSIVLVPFPRPTFPESIVGFRISRGLSELVRGAKPPGDHIGHLGGRYSNLDEVLLCTQG